VISDLYRRFFIDDPDAVHLGFMFLLYSEFGILARKSSVAGMDFTKQGYSFTSEAIVSASPWVTFAPDYCLLSLFPSISTPSR